MSKNHDFKLTQQSAKHPNIPEIVRFIQQNNYQNFIANSDEKYIKECFGTTNQVKNILDLCNL